MKQYTLVILCLLSILVGLESATAGNSKSEKPNIVVDLHR